MSGVFKDESSSAPESDTEQPGPESVGPTDVETGLEPPMIENDTDSQTRKAPPHLRVVAGSDEPEEASGADASVEPATDSEAEPDGVSAGFVESLPEPQLPPLFPVKGESDAASEDAAEPQVRIGVAIREQRESLGLSREDVSKELKLHTSLVTAIEDMNPSALGPRVYAIGHIRDYARFLKLDPSKTLARYKAECAILADPVRKDIAPPVTDRRLPVSAPVFGLLVVGLAAGGAAYFFLNGDSRPASPSAPAVSTAVSTPSPNTDGQAVAPVAAPNVGAQALRIVALTRARVEFRGADGTKFLARYFSPGESYAPRVGAGWTVTTSDGSAFEWRMGDMSLGLLSEDGGPVYAQGVDLALMREPKPIEASDLAVEASVMEPEPVVAEPAIQTPQPAEATPPRAAQTRPATNPGRPAASPQPRRTAPVRQAPQPAPAETVDPSLLAYPE